MRSWTQAPWRPRFSLRMLLSVVLILGVILGIYVRKIAEHKNAINAVRQWRGTSVLYDYQCDWSNKRVDSNAVPPSGTLIARLFGEAAAINFGQVVTNEPDLCDDDLRHLVTLKDLRVLGIHSPNITDQGLRHISKLGNLIELSLLDNDHVTDAGLLHLRSLSKLEHLELNLLPKITDAGRNALQRSLPNCTIRYAVKGELSSSRVVKK